MPRLERRDSRDRGRASKRSKSDSRERSRRRGSLSKSKSKSKNKHHRSRSRDRKRSKSDSRDRDQRSRHRRSAGSRDPFDLTAGINPDVPLPGTGKTLAEMQAEAARRAIADEQERKAKCRIYIGNIFYDVTESDIASIFGAFGAIRSLDMSKDPTSGRHKGYCFIEYMDPESAETAVKTMTGFTLAGRQIKVGRPNAGPGVVTTAPTNVSIQNALATALKNPLQGQVQPTGNTSIYVGNVDLSINADVIRQIFSPFGDIISCEMMADTNGLATHRGYGFIQFVSEGMATSAIQAMQGFELAGRPLRVSWALVQPRNPVVTPSRSIDVKAELAMALGKISAPETTTPQQSAFQVPLMTTAVPSIPMTTSPNLLYQMPSIVTTSQPLQRFVPQGGYQPSNSAPIATPTVPMAQVPPTSNTVVSPKLLENRNCCVLLKNLLSFEEVKDPELKEEILEETRRYGKVDRLEIIMAEGSEKDGVRVFVMYSKESEAAEAISKLNNRYFGRNVVKAALYDVDLFAKGIYDK